MSRRELIIVFFASIFLVLLFGTVGCWILDDLKFDSQALLTWMYSQSEQLIPHKDVFYPYGLFSYYKNTNIGLLFIEILLKSALLSLVYIFLRNIYKSKFPAILSFIIFSFFVVFSISMDTFFRYGLILGLSFTLSIGLILKYHLKKSFHFTAGLLSGLIFIITPDQGLFAILIYGVFLIGCKVLGFTKRLSLSLISLYLLGLFTLLFLFAFFQISFVGYENIGVYLKEIQDIALFAKIPFPPGLISPSNALTIGFLIFSISLLSLRLIILKKRISSIDILNFSLVVPLTLLLQKSVVRSIDTQLVFYGLLLVFLNIGYLKSEKLQSILIIFFGATTIFIWGVKLEGILSPLPWKPFITPKECLDKNFARNKIEDYQVTLEKVRSLGGMKIYSYPADPIFYIINNQKPPYFFSIYEASTLRGQNVRLEYLRKQDIDFVILNKNITSLQDNVPDMVRAKYETKYLLSNYSVVEEYKDFLILKKADVVDENLLFNSHTGLLFVNLGSIPYAEARDKGLNLKDSIFEGNAKSIVSWVDKTKPNSENKIIYLYSNNDKKVQINLGSGRFNSTIVMNSCFKGCIFTIDSAPLFYVNKRIEKIGFSSNVLSVAIYDEHEDLFW